MKIDFKEQMISKSDEDLRLYIDKRSLYVPAAIYAAIAELKKRGQIFSEEEMAAIKADIHKKAEEEKQRELEEEFSDTKNVVTDLNAPAFYSERAIYAFTAGCGVLFASVLMAINFNNTENKKGVVEVILFGIAFTAFQIWVLSFQPSNRGFALFTSAIGALILNFLFWKRYIGKETKYRAKPIWAPLIIGIIFTSLLVLAFINIK